MGKKKYEMFIKGTDRISVWGGKTYRIDEIEEDKTISEALGGLIQFLAPVLPLALGIWFTFLPGLTVLGVGLIVGGIVLLFAKSLPSMLPDWKKRVQVGKIVSVIIAVSELSMPILMAVAPQWAPKLGMTPEWGCVFILLIMCAVAAVGVILVNVAQRLT